MTVQLLKKIHNTISYPIFFYELQLNIDDYKNEFIYTINKGIKQHSNFNYKTNVKGKMTDWHTFLFDKKFHKVIGQGIDEIKKFIKFKPAYLKEAWGIRIDKGDKTTLHDHFESLYSGILYLNKSDVVISFPEIDTHLKPKEGTFLFFSSLLKHGTEENMQEEPKYAIPFNFAESKKF